MKYVSILLGLLMFSACQPSQNKTQKLQNQIDSLKVNVNDDYKPGFGEFMSNIQMHHIKLWFAGKNENWKLADFEINEIKENFEDISQYCTDRPESKLVGMIQQPLENVDSAIQKRDLAQFKNSYKMLTNTCVSCHRTTKHKFIKIQIPDKNIFSDQVFKLENKNVKRNN